MGYLSVAEIAELWGVSERSVRNYCAQGRVPGAFLTGKTWNIPADATKPMRSNAKATDGSPLLSRLREEKADKVKGGIYQKIQVELTYNSNHIEGSRLSLDQTRLIFETATVGFESESLRVDDIVETQNHFRAIDFIIDHTQDPVSEAMIKELHRIMKSSTTDASKDWFAVGDYKRLPNEVGGHETALPEEVAKEMKSLLKAYDPLARHALESIIDFHVRFERIHPFQDGNGRVGRLVMFKECLANDIVPFIISDDMKAFYYRGLAEWDAERGYLTDTCLAAQDRFKATLDYFRIAY
ncbi:MAG: Fic family protein [Eggerthellaceae bacterium]|nr:Fic family protein [Eggerthellaceae bacterium]